MSQLRAGERRWGLLLVLLVGCGAAEPDGMQGGAGSPVGDGLTFDFTSEPMRLPGLVDESQQTTIVAAAFSLRDFRAIGDATDVDAPYLALVPMTFDAQTGSLQVQFSQAPPGYYARLHATLDSLEIQGTVVTSQLYKFLVFDRPPALSISVDLGQVQLRAGGSLLVPIRVALGEIVRGILWPQSSDDGVLVVNSGHPQIAVVRQALTDAFVSP